MNDPETLVAGPAMAGHEFSPGIQKLRGVYLESLFQFINR
jgi:hypothetical protein